MAKTLSIFKYLFLMVLFCAPAYSAGLDDADERLFRVQMDMAKKGNPRAQYYLGEMHEQGLGTKQDVDEAFKWYAMAADQGDALAKRKIERRVEIFTEIKKEQEEERIKATRPSPPKPVAPAVREKPAPKTAPSKQAAPVTKEKPEPQPVVAAIDEKTQADLEKERIRAAEKEKRRATVRKLLLEMQRNPVGGLFE